MAIRVETFESMVDVLSKSYGYCSFRPTRIESRYIEAMEEMTGQDLGSDRVMKHEAPKIS